MTKTDDVVERKTASQSRMGLTAALCGVFVAGMVGMAFAAVPLYDLFCRVTGYGGTTQQADVAPETTLDRPISVRFDANIANDLGWSFRPAVREVNLKIGEPGEVVYIAENRSKRPTTGTAVFNVSPLQAGAYFNKIACFCFTEQALAPGESIEMPVTFFVDPAIEQDSDLDGVHTITLSYTFYPAETEVSAAPAGDESVF
ncbi:cytochrome c oxidase assembly protein [Bauldia sp.]|uniref:cytochrome c oxidase assembly protein n=1 Tax=Bauldia sp. TaxID=2575872 RepID=UPI003BABFEB3